jgi:acetylornithine deacetylase/succinyl-diaminopimelate desuccinylase-like protein
MRTLFRLSVVVAALSACTAAQSPRLDEAARAEAIEILRGLIRIDTSNGNETAAAKYLQALLAKEGIQSEIYELEQGRGNLVARLRGSGKKRPLLLMGHTDVVQVERDKWTVDPFAAEIKDGYLYGRGASDDKGMTAVCAAIMLQLKRHNVPLDRDVIFLAEAGEEAQPHVGIEFMVDRHWDKIEAEFALNEGGWIYQQRDGSLQYVGVSTTEKVPRRFRLRALGSSGHGSMPRVDNAITHLAAAVAKLGQWQAPMRLNETTREFFRRLAEISSPEEAALYRDLHEPAVQERLRREKPFYNSMLRTSIAPTIIRGGFRVNVVPAEAEAAFDIRVLPDEDLAKFTEMMHQVVDDPAVELIPPQGRLRPITPPSRLDTEMFRALVTLPVMLTGATDSAQVRAKGVAAYGVGSIASEDDRSRIHGNDERISLSGLGRFFEYLYTAVVGVAGAK